jgi:hypothetical protein
MTMMMTIRMTSEYRTLPAKYSYGIAVLLDSLHV